jgi:hypothetical protein
MISPQFIGMGVTVLVVLGLDWPIDWLVPFAMLCGGVATLLVTLMQGARN